MSTSCPSSSEPTRIAAVVPQGDTNPDDVVRDFVDKLRQRGVHVAGLLQFVQPTERGCDFCLRDIETGDVYPISQRLGKESSACTLDPSALAEASIVLRRVADHGADLVIFNRFSGMEAEGDGFAAEMLDIMCCAMPCLTIVQEKHLEAWRHFTGGLACELTDSAEALMAWFDRLDIAQMHPD